MSERLSAVAAALEDVYQALAQRWPELPTVAITIFRDRRRHNVLGYFWDGQWRCEAGRLPELHISSTLLDEPAEALLCVLIHEAVHARAAALDIRDTSRDGRYHNGRFADLAREMGLEVAYNRTHGYYTPAVQAEWLDGHYAALRKQLAQATGRLWQDSLSGQTATGGGSGTNGGGVTRPAQAGRLLKAVCKCERPRIVRVARSTFEEGPLICGACWEKFRLDV